jgi:hypothetical protein
MAALQLLLVLGSCSANNDVRASQLSCDLKSTEHSKLATSLHVKSWR